MSAVLKEVATTEPQELIEIMVIQDQLPEDFYTNEKYDAQLDKAIEATTGIIYSLDDLGEKQAKSDATNINKFATMFDKFIAITFKAQTESVSFWRDGKKAKTKLLLANRQQLIDQFAEKRTEKLSTIRTILQNELDVLWTANSIAEQFRVGSIESQVKLTGAVTEHGSITKKAKDHIVAIITDNLAQQRKIEARHLILENRCLRADINPPLTQVHFGSVFYAEDQFFNEKLEELIAAEIDRRAEMEARIIKQQEAQKQKEIAGALRAQQAESDRIATESANLKVIADARFEAERLKNESATAGRSAELKFVDNAVKAATVQTPEELRASADRIEQSAQYADRNEDKRRELESASRLRKQANDLETSISEVNKNIRNAERVAPATGKRTVQITATFNFEDISDRVSNQGVVGFFRKQLPEKLAAIMEVASVENV